MGRIRNTKYSDYGFKDGEENLLKDYCRKKDFDDGCLLFMCATSANPSIKRELYDSIVDKKMTYDNQIKKKYIPLSRPDFYGYQRLCLSIFRNFLLLYGKWK